MKIKKLFLSICMICLAILVMGGATVPAMQFSAQAMAVRAAGEYNALLEPKALFDSKGNYNIDMDYLKTSLVDGQVFNFFGYDWRLVFINEKQNVATFWMADPFTPEAYQDEDEFTGVIFNKTTESADGILDKGPKAGLNIWANGYTNTIWKSDNGDILINQSKIRELLIEEAGNIIDKKAYAKYKNKVVPGYVDGTNEMATEKNTILAYSRNSINNVTVDKTNQLIAQYGLGEADRLWLPSVNELVKKWDVHKNLLNWYYTTNNSGRAWLRNPVIDLTIQEEYGSAYGICVCFNEDSDDDGVKDLFTAKPLKQEAGVRPAIHLDITDLTAVEGNNGGWFNEDWLKTLFIVVCVLGIVGIGLVVTAVVLKSRQKQAK